MSPEKQTKKVIAQKFLDAQSERINNGVTSYRNSGLGENVNLTPPTPLPEATPAPEAEAEPAIAPDSQRLIDIIESGIAAERFTLKDALPVEEKQPEEEAPKLSRPVQIIMREIDAAKELNAINTDYFINYMETATKELDIDELTVLDEYIRYILTSPVEPSTE
jgi:hypothetical protein